MVCRYLCAALAIAALLITNGCKRGDSSASQPSPGNQAASDIQIDLTGRPRVREGTESALDPGAETAIDAEPLTLSSHPMLFLRGSVDVSKQSSVTALQVAYGKIRKYMTANGLAAAGAPIATTENFDHDKNIWTFHAGIPLASAPASISANADGITLGKSYSGAVMKFVHHGDPNQAEPTYAKIHQWFLSHGMAEPGASWEEYVSDPATPVDQWQTNIYIPIG